MKPLINIGSRERLAIFGIGFAIGIAVISAGVDVWFFSKAFEALNGGIAQFEYYALMDFVTWVRLSSLFAGLFGMVFYSLWVYRAAINMRNFGVSGMQHHPAMAVAYTFIPLANLWMPLLVMNELWKGSYHMHKLNDEIWWKNYRVSRLVPLWWTVLMVYLIATYVRSKLPIMLGSIEMAIVTEVLSTLLYTGAGILIIVIIRKVSWLQKNVAANSDDVLSKYNVPETFTAAGSHHGLDEFDSEQGRLF